MKISRIENFTNGWFIGNFEPSILRVEAFEVCLKTIRKGEKQGLARQKVATEVSLLIEGKALVNGHEFVEGDVWLLDSMESADFVALEDCKIIGVKSPSLPADKEVL